MTQRKYPLVKRSTYEKVLFQETSDMPRGMNGRRFEIVKKSKIKR